MRNYIIKIGFVLTVCFSLTGIFNAGAANANNLDKAFAAQVGSGCKVTKAGGASMYAASLDKDVFLKRGAFLTVVDPSPHQGIIVVRARVNKKLIQGEIKFDETNCAPVLPQ